MRCISNMREFYDWLHFCRQLDRPKAACGTCRLLPLRVPQLAQELYARTLVNAHVMWLQYTPRLLACDRQCITIDKDSLDCPRAATSIRYSSPQHKKHWGHESNGAMGAVGAMASALAI